MRKLILMAFILGLLPFVAQAGDCNSGKSKCNTGCKTACNTCKPACETKCNTCSPCKDKCNTACKSSCNSCKPKCNSCEKPSCGGCKTKCNSCAKPSCGGCKTKSKCNSCDKPSCGGCKTKCNSCAKPSCGGCKTKCNSCAKPSCGGCGTCNSCAKPACPAPCACTDWKPYCGCETVSSLCITLTTTDCDGTAGPLYLLLRDNNGRKVTEIELAGPINGWYSTTYTFETPVKADSLREAVLINKGDDAATMTSFSVTGMNECWSWNYFEHSCPGVVIGKDGCPRFVMF